MLFIEKVCIIFFMLLCVVSLGYLFYGLYKYYSSNDENALSLAKGMTIASTSLAVLVTFMKMTMM